MDLKLAMGTIIMINYSRSMKSRTQQYIGFVSVLDCNKCTVTVMV